MSLLASMSGNPVLGLVLLPFFLAWPFIMVTIVVRAFLKGEAQSLLIVLLLIIMLVCGGLFAWKGGLQESHPPAYLKVWSIALMAGIASAPFALAYEVYKQGWLHRWLNPVKTMKKPQRDE